MPNEFPDGPSWLGIGTQRSGTTWLTNLLLEHPKVELGLSGEKESHLFYRGIMPEYVPMKFRPGSRLGRIAQDSVGAVRHIRNQGSDSTYTQTARIDEYLAQFPRDGLRRGEWTPDYLPCIWAASAVRDLVRKDVPLLVVLRDPVERFASAMRLESSRSNFSSRRLAELFIGGHAISCGMYLQQLETWASIVGRERLLVSQYELVRTDPQAWADQTWRRIGLDPIKLQHTERASKTSRPSGWEWPDGLKSLLMEHYRSQRSGLEKKWGIDTSLWINQ